MKGENKRGNELLFYKNGEERRVIRVLSKLYQKNKPFMFPRDIKSVSFVMYIIYDLIAYGYKRITEKNYVDKEMLDEFRNVSIVITGYCSVDEGRLWYEELNDFFISLFKYALLKGISYNKELVMELLIDSGLLKTLCLTIDAVQAYEYDLLLFDEYINDPSVKTKYKNMLCFISYRVCKSIIDKTDYDIDTLESQELIEGLESGFFKEGRKKAECRLVSILKMKKETSPAEYYELGKNIIYLQPHISLNSFKGIIESHPIYMIMHTPEKVDYSEISLICIKDLRKQDMIDKAKKHGGYILYRRVRGQYRRDKRVKFFSPFKAILDNESYKYIYDCEMEQDRLGCKKKKT